mmetsp:Transcript_33514/g.49448  ORF Transcript_33514/g.49448 Transcript_33514/m.49448 type:complete len:255 (-) Transcript_33514:1302-2066(-)
MNIRTLFSASSPMQLHSVLQIFLGLAVSLFTLRLGAGLFAFRAANKLERPSYQVIRRLPAGKQFVEIRKYNPYLIAETIVDESSMRKAGGKGFGKCASYIFGQNISNNKMEKEDSEEKMQMTAPVRSVGEISNNEKMQMTAPVRSVAATTAKKTKISFVIGSKYNLKTVPKPKNKSVKIVKVDEHTIAAVTFAGPPPSDDRITKERDLILQTLEKEGIRAKGKETMVYGYHDPVITPNFLRRNEVAVMVDGKVM